MRLETVFGRIKFKFAYGAVSEKIVEKMTKAEENARKNQTLGM